MIAHETAPDVTVAVKKWRRKRGNLIMVLHEIHNHHGYLPRGLALQVAKEMNVPLARIYEVLTFYNYFKLTPPGKFVVSVCLGTACYLKGGGDLFAAMSEELKVGEGETTPDGLFHLQGVRCLGCCGLAPVVMVNGRIYSKVRPGDVRNIIADCHEQKEPVDGKAEH